MSRQTLVNALGEWLIDQALSQPDIVAMFEQVCNRLYAIGVPLSRARLTWPTLHPLFQAETILWIPGAETEFEQFKHQDEASEEWLKSPMNYVLENEVDTLRRNLDGPNKLLDFPLMKELAAEGQTDYLMTASAFNSSTVRNTRMESGILVSWCSRRAGGFSEEDLSALKKIQRRLAVACKSAIQQRIAHNITGTYLGMHAGNEVLEGAIKLGDGRSTRAVVWYTDMRNSTALADTMPPEEFLKLLNDYFECTAGAAIAFGGEVLDFIGDAVLAIFPYDEEETGKAQAISCATMAMEKSIVLASEANARRAAEGKTCFDFGIGINTGTLMFGNIGVASRLSFSVIGQTVNEVERIETLTKAIESKAVVSAEIAAQEPKKWHSLGPQRLNGVAHESELFAYKADEQQDAPVERETPLPLAVS